VTRGQLPQRAGSLGLKLRWEDRPNLKTWIAKRNNYTSNTIQNEILEMFVRSWCSSTDCLWCRQIAVHRLDRCWHNRWGWHGTIFGFCSKLRHANFCSTRRLPRDVQSQLIYSVSQKISLWGVLTFFIFFTNGWEFLIDFYTPITCSYLRQMPDYKFLFNYPRFWRSYAILSATTQST